MKGSLSGGCSKKRNVEFLATPGTFSEHIFRVLSVMVFHYLGVTPVLEDKGVNRTSPLETAVNEWELLFMRCYIPSALSMNNRGLTGTNMSECFMTTSEAVRTCLYRGNHIQVHRPCRA